MDSISVEIMLIVVGIVGVLSREFQRSRQQLAIVVNEYGDVEGLVTIKDVGGHRWTVLEVDGPRVTKLRVEPER